MNKKIKLGAVACVAAIMTLLGGDGSILETGSLVGSAEAVRGRPATPVSYAGVARRTTRRAVAVGAASTTCVQAVDAYGRVVTKCY
jgi:hypothetical protein